MKKVAALLVCVALTVLSVVPAFAGPREEVEAAIAAQSQRTAEYIAYQENLQNFYLSQLAKGEAERAAGIARYNAYQAQLAAFQQSQIAKGEAERAAGLASGIARYNAYQAQLAAFQQGQIAKGLAERAAGQARYDAYQSAYQARRAQILAQEAAIKAERAELQKLVNAYLKSF